MVTVAERKPTPAEYESIVASVGFRTHDHAAVEIALANTIFAVCALEEQEVVGVVVSLVTGQLVFFSQTLWFVLRTNDAA